MIFFYNIKHANLNADADDHQLYSSNKDLETLNRRLRHEIRISNSWYKQNGKIVNTEKDQEMVLGTDSNYEFSFSVKNSIDLLGVTIDKDLSFNHHISQICGKVNNQFSVLKRTWGFSFTTPSILLSHLAISLESLNRRILRFIFNDRMSSYNELLHKANSLSLYFGRIHKMLMVIYNSLFKSTYPKYVKELFIKASCCLLLTH